MAVRNVAHDPRRFYVYVIFRLDGTPCYVGKGQRDRWQVHRARGSNIHLRRIYAAAGRDLPRVKVREGLTDAEALATEVALIAAIGREVNGGPLVNMTDGGDGISGHRHTEEVRRRIHDALAGRPKAPGFGAKLSAALTGITRTAEHRAATGRASKGRKHSPETREQIAAALRGRKRTFSPEHCRRISEAKKGKKLTPEHRAKIALAGLGRLHTEAEKKAIGDAQRGIPRPQRGRKRNGKNSAQLSPTL